MRSSPTTLKPPLPLFVGDVLTLRKPHPCGGRDWTVVRLQISAEERRRRVLSRGLLLGNVEQDIEPWIEESDEDERNLDDQSLPAIVLQADGLTREGVADLVLRRTGWPSLD